MPIQTAAETRSQRITMRVSASQRDLLDEACRAQATSLTEFILQAATARAGDVLVNRRLFELPDERYQAFLAVLDRPVEIKPRLRRLLAEPSVFDE